MKRSILVICTLIALIGAAASSVPVQAQANACAKAAPPHLKTGTSAQITKPSSSNFPGAFLKPDPGRAGPVLRYIPVGTTVDVLDGPRCGDDRSYWWRVKLGDLTGWLAEVAGKGYALEPASASATATPLPSTVASVLTCVARSTPVAPATAPGTQAAGDKLDRVVYGTLDGWLMVSDNGGLGRQLAMFNPPPLSVDLAPDGTAAAVVTYNGVYWVDVATGKTIMLADATTFGLQEGAYPSRVTWLPNKSDLAVEITDTQDNVISYALWSVATDGTHPPFRVDTGAQPQGGVYKAPVGDKTIVVSANDISLFPKDLNDSSPSLIEFVPKQAEGDVTQLVAPAISWAQDGKGFYTYIPISPEAAPSDPVAGHVLYVPLEGDVQDLGKQARLKPNDYVIPSPDGTAVLAGRGAAWAIQNVKSGTIIQTLPPVQYVFGWVPDGSGVVFTNRTGEIKFLGTDGSPDSDFVPTATDVFHITWLTDDTIMYAIKGKDGKLSFKIRRGGEDDKFLGLISTVNAFSGVPISGKAGPASVPQPCK